MFCNLPQSDTVVVGTSWFAEFRFVVVVTSRAKLVNSSHGAGYLTQSLGSEFIANGTVLELYECL